MNKLVLIETMGKRVFTAQDLAVLWGYEEEKKLYELIKYYIRQKQIFALTRGLYATRPYTQQDLRNDPRLLLEIANRLVRNSYVSLFTVLVKEGVIYQYYDEVYSVAARSVTREVAGVKFVYKRVKEGLVMNELGIEVEEGVRMASLERAVADTWYLYPQWEMENLGRVKKDKLVRIAKMYGGKRMKTKIQEIKEGEC